MELLYLAVGGLIFASGLHIGMNLNKSTKEPAAFKVVLPKITKKDKEVIEKEEEDNEKINKFFN